MNNNIEVIRSQRSSISIEIKPDLRVIVRAPRHMKEQDIKRFVEQKRFWIEKHLLSMQQKQSVSTALPLSDEEISVLKKQARTVIAERVAFFAPIIGVKPGNITVRCQKTRWGSCSSKNNLSFNCLLMLCPAQVLDYVVVHELCHLIHLNHSSRFWEQVKLVMPDYQEYRQWLRQNGSSLTAHVK